MKLPFLDSHITTGINIKYKQQATRTEYGMMAYNINEQVFTGRSNIVPCVVEAYCPHWPSATESVILEIEPLPTSYVDK